MKVLHEGEVYSWLVTAGDYLKAVEAIHKRGYTQDAQWEDVEDLLREMGWTVTSKVAPERHNESFNTEPDGELSPTIHTKELLAGDLFNYIGEPPFSDPAALAERLLEHMEAPKLKKKMPKGEWSRSHSSPAPWYFGATSKPPEHLSPGQFYVLKYSISPGSEMREGATYIGDLVWSNDQGIRVNFTYLRGVEGVTITNPAGKSQFVKEPANLERTGKDRWDSNTGPMRVSNALDKLKFKSAFKTWSRGSAKTKKKTRTPERTMKNTGTCAICDRNVKLTRGGKMWDHGYQVPWDQGGRTQGCFGVGYPPYEQSMAACEAYIRSLEKLLVSTQTKLDNADDVEKLPHPHKRGRQFQMIEPGHQFWDTAFQRYTGRLRQTINMVPKEIKVMQTKVDQWEPKPLPGERGR